MKKSWEYFQIIKQKALSILPESFFEKEKIQETSPVGKIKNMFSKKQKQECITGGKRRLKKTVKIFLRILWVLLLLGMIGYFIVLYFARDIETIITFPGKDINLKEITNHPAGLIVAKEIFLTTPEWDTIHGVYIDNNAEKTVYYFHGNGAPVQHFFTEMRYISDLWYNLMAYDYPGYGKSTGQPSLETIRQFSSIFFRHMKQEYQFQDENMILWWYSIGTALAVDFGQDKDFDSLVLFSPLASRYEMSEKFFGFPIQKMFFLPNGLISRETIKNIDEPTLIVHGNNDVVVPIAQWKTIYENSPATVKRFIEVDDFGHSLITETYGDVLHDYIRNFLWADVALPPSSWKVRQTEHTVKKQDSQTWSTLTDYKKQKQDEIFLNRKIATAVLQQQKKMQQIVDLDIQSDDSLTKYVDPNVSFQDVWYIPQDLRKLERTHLRDIKWDAQLREEAATRFEELAWSFYTYFWEKIDVVSSYRSYKYQAGIKSRGCPDHLCAKAGHSEHQSWLAIDLWSASTLWEWQQSPRLQSYYNWLWRNAHFYGWHNPYRKWVDIDGYDPEPWHWRYLWVDLAGYLYEHNVTFAEYYKARQRQL